jgi:flavin-dependent dehydrogenase
MVSFSFTKTLNPLRARAPHYSDVVIIGGGPAGTTTGMLLARSGISAVVLETGTYSGHSMGQTLSPALNPLLAQLQIDLDPTETGSICCRGTASVWGRNASHQSDFFWTPYGNSSHVERPRLDRVLARAAVDAGAQVLCNTRMRSCRSLARGRWSLEVQSGNIPHGIQCRFLVVATGRVGNSALSNLVRSVVYDRLVGISWVGKSRKSNPFTLIETVSGGWFYASSMPGSRCTVVLMTDSDICRGNGHEQSQFWHRQFRQARHISEAFPESVESDPQRTFSASTILRTPASGPSWLYVGDAAMSFDPVSGEGVYQALLGASHAATAICKYFRTGWDPRSYDSWLGSSFRQYRSLWHKCYSVEQRWNSSLFWQRRHASHGM